MSEAQIFQQLQFQRSPITQALYDRLKLVEEGEFILYGELDQLIHQKAASSHNLATARRLLLDDLGFVFQVVRGPNGGLIRLTNEQIAPHSNYYHKRRLLNDNVRYRNKLAAVDVGRLDPVGKIQFSFGLAIAALRDAAVSPKTEKTIMRNLNRGPQAVNFQSISEAVQGIWK